MVDIDGVISLFARRASTPGPRRARSTRSTAYPHFLSAIAAAHLLALSDHFELVWASGWEERAEEHLPRLLGLPADLPFLRFDREIGRSNAHWKLDAIDATQRSGHWRGSTTRSTMPARAGRPRVARRRCSSRPTRSRGLTAREADRLSHWAHSLAAG